MVLGTPPISTQGLRLSPSCMGAIAWLLWLALIIQAGSKERTNVAQKSPQEPSRCTEILEKFDIEAKANYTFGQGHRQTQISPRFIDTKESDQDSNAEVGELATPFLLHIHGDDGAVLPPMWHAMAEMSAGHPPEVQRTATGRERQKQRTRKCSKEVSVESLQPQDRARGQYRRASRTLGCYDTTDKSCCKDTFEGREGQHNASDRTHKGRGLYSRRDQRSNPNCTAESRKQFGSYDQVHLGEPGQCCFVFRRSATCTLNRVENAKKAAIKLKQRIAEADAEWSKFAKAIRDKFEKQHVGYQQQRAELMSLLKQKVEAYDMAVQEMKERADAEQKHPIEIPDDMEDFVMPEWLSDEALKEAENAENMETENEGDGSQVMQPFKVRKVSPEKPK